MSYDLSEDTQAMSLAAPPPSSCGIQEITGGPLGTTPSLLDVVFARPKIQEALKGQTVDKVVVTDRVVNITTKPSPPGYAHWKPCRELDCKLCNRRTSCRLYWETQQVIYPSYIG
jgi:hypothetical protein